MFRETATAQPLKEQGCRSRIRTCMGFPPADFKSAPPRESYHTGRRIAARTHARAPRSVTHFPRAPPEGRTAVIDGSRPYAALNARRISRVTLASPFPLPPSRFPRSTSTAPPQPAPVSRDAGACRCRHLQHRTAVVVGVLADQVDAPRRRRDDPRCNTERRAEQG